jgi:hypothetical protein
MIHIYYNAAVVYVTFIFSSSLVLLAKQLLETTFKTMYTIFYYLYLYPVELFLKEFDWLWQDVKKFYIQVLEFITKFIPIPQSLMNYNQEIDLTPFDNSEPAAESTD